MSGRLKPQNGLRRQVISLNINGHDYAVQAPDDMPLLWILRDLLDLKGTKFGCGIAQCGACTVHVDGRPVRSCMLTAANVGLRKVTTIEAIGQTESGRRIQQAWLDLEVVQCGYCQSGQIMSAAALIERDPAPDDAEIDAAGTAPTHFPPFGSIGSDTIPRSS
jgi:isoquinoline 1-oxidoreductase subunit alpha